MSSYTLDFVAISNLTQSCTASFVVVIIHYWMHKRKNSFVLVVTSLISKTKDRSLKLLVP
jgi:hypothetical protein